MANTCQVSKQQHEYRCCTELTDRNHYTVQSHVLLHWEPAVHTWRCGHIHTLTHAELQVMYSMENLIEVSCSEKPGSYQLLLFI